MFLSWWRSLVKLANPKNENSKSLRRRRIPRKFRSAMRVEQLEDRMVPAGTANVFLNVGTVASPLSTVTATRGSTVPVFIDFNTINTGPAVVTFSQTGSFTFSYSGTSGNAFAYTSGASGSTAADFQTYIRAITANLSTATVTGNTGGPFTVNFPSGSNSFNLTVANVANKPTITTNSGLGAGTFYIMYDPTVLAITSVVGSNIGPDVKLGSLLNTGTLPSFYSVVPASGFATGVVAIGLNHTGTTFLNGVQSGHLIELDFHVVSSAPSIGFSSLLDLQSTYTDAAGSLHAFNIKDTAAVSYNQNPSSATYAKLSNQSNLTQSGALAPSGFTPSDTDATDASIKIIQGTPPKTPTANNDTFSMAPNDGNNFYSTMAVAGATNSGSNSSNNAGPLNGVLANDSNAGPMYATLTTPGTTSTVLAPQFTNISGLTETGMVVTVTTTAPTNFLPGEQIVISGVGTSGYNGTFEISTVDPVDQMFTYINSVSNGPPVIGLSPDPGGTNAIASSPVATTIYTAATAQGTVWLNAADGTFAYSPNPGFSGTDTFTYQAVDAATNTASATATVTINVGGVLNIPQGIKNTSNQPATIGDTVIVPVIIGDPNPANSGGLGNITIGINYDPNVFDPNNITINEGDVNTAAGWTAFTTSNPKPGQIVITTSQAGGPPPIFSTTGGTIATITFSVIGMPTGATSLINLASAVPQTSQLDVIATGTPVSLPMAFAPLDNTNFNGPPGVDDGTVDFAFVSTNPVVTVSAAVGGSSVTTVTYGTPVTLTATVSLAAGGAPTGGKVDFKDGATDLTPGGVTGTPGTGVEIFTYITTAAQLQVLQLGGGVHNNITANFTGAGTDGNGTGTLTPGLTVNPAPLTITATTNAKTYDATISAAAAPTVSGLIGTNTVTGLTEVYADKNAGSSKTLSVSAYTVQDNNGGLDYTVTTVTNTTGSITKANLTITALANTKTFDGNVTATTKPTVSGLLGTDTVTNQVEVYSDANTGTGKTLSVSAYTITDGNSGNNYTVTTQNNTQGEIDAAAGVTTTTSVVTSQASVVYGAPVTFTITVTASSGTAPGAGGSVDVTDNSSHDLGLATFVSSTGLVSTYTLTTSPTTLKVTSPLVHVITANFSEASFGSSSGTVSGGQTVTPAPLTITATTNAKTYDATTSAAAAPTVTGLVGTDTVTGLAEVYADKNAGSSKTLSVSAYTVSDGNSGNNYTVTTVTNTTGSITKANLTITALANTKNFDGNVTATTKPTVSGLLGTDTVTNQVEVYSDANTGTGKTLSVSAYTITDGNSGNNYTVTTQNNTQGEIDAAAGVTTTTSVVTSQASVVYGTPVTFTITVTASSGTAPGTGGSVDVTDNTSHDLGLATFVSSTGLVSTYTLTTSPTTLKVTTPLVHVITANFSEASFGSSSGTVTGGQTVTPASLTITATTNAKTYDATTSAAAAPTVTGLVGTDTVTGLAEVYADKNAGSSKTLSVSAYTVSDGNSGNNYTVTTVTNTTGSITKANLTITALANTKNFDGNVTASTKPTVSGLLGTDTVTNQVEVYSDANTGTGKTLSVSAYTITDGNSGNNYTVTTQNNTQGEIDAAASVTTTTSVVTSQASVVYGTPVTFTITVTASSGTAPGASGSVDVTDNTSHDLGLATFVSSTGLVSTYTLTTSPTTLKVTSPLVHVITANFSEASFGSSSGTVTGGQTVTPASLTITATTNAKTYDATTSAAASPTVTGLFGTDTVTGLAEVYADKNVGTSKTLSVSAYTVSDGNSGNNYTVTTVTNTTGSITKANLTITALTNTKAYDSTTNAAATPTVTGLLGTDSVSGAKEVYATSSAGSGKALSVSAYTVSDGNSGNNYNITTVTNTTGVITKANLTITATTNAKTYDATTTAAASPTVAGLIGTDSVTGLLEVYADKNAGSSKTLSVSSYTVSDGNSGNNYTVTTVPNTTGSITKANLTITAVANTKPFDGTVSAAAKPTVSGLLGTDTVTNQAEVYSDPNTGTGKTLSVSAYTVNDGNSGNNYTVTTAINTQGEIDQVNGFGTTTSVVTSSASVAYGTPVTFTITVTAAGGTTAPGAGGSVDVTDNTSHDLGLATFVSSTGLASTYTLTTLPKSFNVTSPLAHVITANFSEGTAFGASTGTLAGGQTVTPASLTIKASTNTKNYDSTTTAAATPTVTGLVSGDTVTGMTEVYTDANAGTGKTLRVTGYSVSDGNGGNNYTVTTASDATGVINKAPLTITAVFNSKPFDGNTTATAIPTVSGLKGNDSVTGQTEAYTDSTPGSGKTLTVNPGYTVTDGNGGNNYAVTTVPNTTGIIANPNSTITLTPSNGTGTVIAPPQGSTYAFNLIIAVNQPLDFTVTYQTVNGTATAGADFIGKSNGTVHINDAPIHGSNAVSSVMIPITILGDGPQMPGGPSVKSFSVSLIYSVSNGSGNAVTNTETASSVINIQQVFAPVISVPATQANATAAGNPFVTWTSTYVDVPSEGFTAAQYAQGAGDVYVNYNTKLNSANFSTASFKIPYADFTTATGNFQIPNFKVPTNPAAGTLNITLAAVTPNAALGNSTGTIGYPQLAAGTPTGAPGGVVLSASTDISSVVSAAEANWVAVGANPQSFQNVQVQIGTLSKGVLADTAGSVITIDASAGGFGWYTNTSSNDFQPVANSVDQSAKAGTAAVGHMDLLTVVDHELGHVLGLPDVTTGADNLMTQTLSAGTRRLPTASLLIGIVPPATMASQATAPVQQLWPSPTLVPVNTLLAAGTPSNAKPAVGSANSALSQVFTQTGPLTTPAPSAAALTQVFATLGQTKAKI